MLNRFLSPSTSTTFSLTNLLTWPCFQHSRKIFQLLLLLGSCRQRRRPSHSHVWEVWGSSTLRPITPSLRVRLPDSLLSVGPETRRLSAFLFSTTEAMMWSRMVGRPPFALSACGEESNKTDPVSFHKVQSKIRK